MIESDELKEQVLESLDNLKAIDVRVLDVRQLTDFTDYMVVATGTSNRHVQSLVNNVAEDVKEKGVKPLGIEGKESGDWILIDLVDVVVHVMTSAARELYDLERLWEVVPDRKGKGDVGP